MKKVITTDAAPRPAGPYNQLVVANGFAFSAGFGPQDPATSLVPEGAEAQTRQVLRNIEAALGAAGLGLGDVVKVTAHLQHLHRDGAAYNAAYTELMPAPHPVRTTVGSDLADILVEIDVVAAVPESA